MTSQSPRTGESHHDRTREWFGSNLPRITEQPDDRTLVAAAQAGDRDALDQLLRRHYERVWMVCRRLAGNEADALDATQEALIALATRIDRYDGRAAFATWAYRVATNSCLDELRRRGRRPTPGLPDDHESGGHLLPDRQPDVADQVATRLEVDEALEQLPDDFRIPVVLRDLCGLDYAEIASTLDLAPGTVRSRISRGRAALQRHLSGNQSDDAERQNKRR